jgi:hypothetical protein
VCNTIQCQSDTVQVLRLTHCFTDYFTALSVPDYIADVSKLWLAGSIRLMEKYVSQFRFYGWIIYLKKSCCVECIN